MADTVNDVVTRAQAKLNDREGRSFDLAYLLPFINAANEEIAIRLIQVGDRQLRDSTTITVPASVSVLDKTTTPSLPADLYLPLNLKERATGSQDRYIPMIDRRDLDPSTPQTDRLRYWQWRANQIRLLGSVVSTDILLAYFFMPAALSSGGDEFQYEGFLESIAKIVAYEAAESRGTMPPPMMETLKSEYESTMKAVFGANWKQGIVPQVGS